MNRKRRLTVVGAAAAGLIGVATLTGAASASAATTSAPAPSAPSAAVPAKPAGDASAAPKPADAPKAPETRKAAAHTSADRILAKVKAAVVARYPKATVTDIRATSNGWTVSLTTARGQKATVTVDKDLQVGRLALVQQGSHRR